MKKLLLIIFLLSHVTLAHAVFSIFVRVTANLEGDHNINVTVEKLKDA